MKLPFGLNKARKLSEEDIERIFALYMFGVSISSIAEEMKVSRYAIYHHIYKEFFPEKFAEMEQKKVFRNKNYRDSKGTERERDRLKRLRIAHGVNQVSKHRESIKSKWVKENKDKFLQTRTAYRNKNREHINKNWRKNYKKRKGLLPTTDK